MSIKRIIIRAFLLSILLHLIVFNFLNFRFDSKKEPTKTSFDFLGSFLGRHDMEFSSTSHPLSKTKRTYRENIDSDTSSSDPGSHIFKDDQKPELITLTQSHSKKTLKTETLSSIAQQEVAEPIENLETSDITNHIRLKLPNDDHY
ncbi:MAG: hypothetical protein PHY73_07755 [Candidatus Omnitrophica bacterium]|nr:hypothetical protein [Candidatus Omnitrophota bacterium]